MAHLYPQGQVKQENGMQQQQQPNKPVYTGRRNSALALARRASMADVLANNQRRTGSLGDVLDGNNSASSSLQLYLQSLIPRESAATDATGPNERSSPTKSKRKSKETKEAKRARKEASAAVTGTAPSVDSSTPSANKRSKSLHAPPSPPLGTHKSTPSVGSESMCDGLLLYPSPLASRVPASCGQLYVPHNPSQAHQEDQGGRAGDLFPGFDECFGDAITPAPDPFSSLRLTAPSTVAMPLPTSSPALSDPCHARSPSMQSARPTTPPNSSCYSHYHQHQVSPHAQHQQAYVPTVMGPPAPMSSSQPAAFLPPTSPAQLVQINPHTQTYAHHHAQASQLQQHLSAPSYFPSPQPSPAAMANEWSGLPSQFPHEPSWQPRSPALSMHEQIERMCPAFPASPSASAPSHAPGASSVGVRFPAVITQPPVLRPPDVHRVEPVPSTFAAAASCPATTVGEPLTLEGGIPAPSPLSNFFDWADEVLAFDPTMYM